MSYRHLAGSRCLCAGLARGTDVEAHSARIHGAARWVTWTPNNRNERTSSKNKWPDFSDFDTSGGPNIDVSLAKKCRQTLFMTTGHSVRFLITLVELKLMYERWLNENVEMFRGMSQPKIQVRPNLHDASISLIAGQLCAVDHVSVLYLHKDLGFY